MNEPKLNRLFRAARQETPPTPEPAFEQLVLTAIRREAVPPEAETNAWLEPFGAWFPRLAWVTAVVMVLCVAVDFGLTARSQADLNDSLLELSEQWLFAAN